MTLATIRTLLRIWLLVCLLLLGLHPGNAGAQESQEPMTLAEYVQLLQWAVQQLQDAGDSDVITLSHVRDRLALVTGVALPSGEIVRAQPLLADANAIPVALARLQLVHSQLLAASADDTAARLALLDQVFQRWDARSESLWDRMRRWLGDQLARILPERLPEAPAAATPLAQTAAQATTWVLAALGAVLLILLLSHWFQGLLGSFVADAELRRRLAAGEELPLTAAGARQEATAAARAGDFRQAVRQLYLAALLQLEERDLLRHDPSLTNREVLAAVSALPQVHARLRPVVQTFDDVWYGVHEPDMETFGRYSQDIDGLSHVLAEPQKEEGR